jgi:hypothetical protein
MTPTELWLPIGAAAFYLYDSACLLWQNELIFTRAGSRWLVTGGSELRLSARRVFLPNPLLPARPQFQVRWSLNESRTDAADTPEPLLKALRPIGVINQLQLLLLLALPALAWTLGAGLLLLVLFMLFYVLTLTALAMVWRRRPAFHLDTRAFWLLALDVLACAPFATNLTRRLSMRHGIAGDPLRLAARHMDPPTRNLARDIIASRLLEEHAGAAQSTEREQDITRLFARLAGEP